MNLKFIMQGNPGNVTFKYYVTFKTPDLMNVTASIMSKIFILQTF